MTSGSLQVQAGPVTAEHARIVHRGDMDEVSARAACGGRPVARRQSHPPGGFPTIS